MADTKIEWAEKSWNPVTGCTKMSGGCQNCYAERMSKRLAGRYGYPKDEPFRVTIHRDRINDPLRWKEPRRIFVCSMGDLFHPDVPNSAIYEILIMAKFTAPQHQYLVLTKRPERMRDMLWRGIKSAPNMWLGVSVENQKRADERIPILLQIPAKVRFVSIEPMLGPVDLTKWLPEPPEEIPFRLHDDVLQWVILGAETGAQARLMKEQWALDVKDQCTQTGTPFFYKRGSKKNGRLLDGKLWEAWPE